MWTRSVSHYEQKPLLTAHPRASALTMGPILDVTTSSVALKPVLSRSASPPAEQSASSGTRAALLRLLQMPRPLCADCLNNWVEPSNGAAEVMRAPGCGARGRGILGATLTANSYYLLTVSCSHYPILLISQLLIKWAVEEMVHPWYVSLVVETKTHFNSNSMQSVIVGQAFPTPKSI